MAERIERFDPTMRERLAYEHLHRYAMARDVVGQMRVLDAACGEGYGSWILSRVARHVIGIDVDPDVIETAQDKYADGDKLLFQAADCHKLPFSDESFDAIVSYETIEHVANPDDVLREFRRVLRSDGILLISTPNKPVYNRYKERNLHHVKEFCEQSYVSLLNRFFSNVRLFGQRLALVSSLGPAGERETSSSSAYVGYLPETASGRIELRQGVAQLRDPEYFVALCGNEPLPRMTEPSSIFVDSSDDLWASQEKVLHWASGVHGELEQERLRGDALRNQLIQAKQEAALAGDRARKVEAEAELNRAAMVAQLDKLIQAQATASASRAFQAAMMERLDRLFITFEKANEQADLDRISLQSAIKDTWSAAREAKAQIASLEIRFDEEARQREAITQRLEERLEESQANLRGEIARNAMSVKQLVRAQGQSAAANRDVKAEIVALSNHVRNRALDDEALLGRLDSRLVVTGYRTAALADLAVARAHLLLRKDRFPRGSSEDGPSPSQARPGRRQCSILQSQMAKKGLFDAEWYRRIAPSAAALADEAALAHFVSEGLPAGISPHPLIDLSWLAAATPERSASIGLRHLIQGAIISPHPLFNARFYLDVYPDVASYGDGPFIHYIVHGAAEGRQPHPAFRPDWFIRHLPPGLQRAPNALATYVSRPETFAFDPHPLFNAQHYRRALGESRWENPLIHYIKSGEHGGLSPHPLFDPAYYLLKNEDSADHHLGFLGHFIQIGAREHRLSHPLFDPTYYSDTNRSVVEAVLQPLEHYVVRGAQEGRSPDARLPLRLLLQAMPGLDPSVENPLVALMNGAGLSTPSLSSAAAATNVTLATPPTTAAKYQLPTRLREYVEQRFDTAPVAPLRYLMSIVTRYGDDPDAFVASEEYDTLLERIRKASGRRQDNPDVTIVIPVHNALVFTMTCLVSLLELDTSSSFEVLIGDDASTDETFHTFSEVGGRVDIVSHLTNVGFLANCNLVAARARGRHILLLNNDTIPLPDWLDSLVALADRDGSIGLVGSKLLNGDGTLQEAGGIVWNDGSAWNYGRNDDPDAPAYNYVRDVDYCSGASILIPASVWTELGGFDPEFSPAYCEDSDFAFRARRAGYRTIYQPFSEIIHHEGRSHGRDEQKGIKQHQVTNSRKLTARWRETLERENLPNGQQVTLARDRSQHRVHLLVVDHYIPQWDRDAGSRTMFHFLKAFVAEHIHVVFWSDNLYRDPKYIRSLQEMGIEVIYGSAFVGQFPNWISANSSWIDVVLLSRPHISIKYIDAIKRNTSATIIYYGHDVHWKRLIDEYEVNRLKETLAMSREYKSIEMRLWMLSDVILYPSEFERDLVRNTLIEPNTVLSVPAWTFDAAAVERARARGVLSRNSHRILFVGGFTHGPNVDGIRWFCSEVLPRIRRHDPNFMLLIVGSNAPPDVIALENEAIQVLGFVDDGTLGELYDGAGVSIAPLRFGGGVKGKVIEAFAKGIPVVSTSVGVQGIAESDKVAFVADTAEAFAAAVIEASEHPEHSQMKVDAASAFVQREYSAAKLMSELAPYLKTSKRSVGEPA